MLPYLAAAAQSARERAGRKQVHVAASLSKDQSTIYRFEQGVGWPRNPDEIIQAYADDLDIAPVAIWEDAVSRMRAAATGRPAEPADDEIPGPGDAGPGLLGERPNEPNRGREAS